MRPKESIVGSTKREIVKFVLDYPEGVGEPLIREYLAEKLNIRDSSNIKAHLEKLSHEKILIKERYRGRPNKWKLAYSEIEPVAEYIIWEFLKTAPISHEDSIDAFEIFSAKSTQKFIKEATLGKYFLNFLFFNKTTETDYNNSKIWGEDLLIHIYFPLVSFSPTLFSELFYPTLEMRKYSVCLFRLLLADAENLNDTSKVYYFYQSKFLAPLLRDYAIFGIKMGKMIDYLRNLPSPCDDLHKKFLKLSEDSLFNSVVDFAIIKEGNSENPPKFLSSDFRILKLANDT